MLKPYGVFCDELALPTLKISLISRGVDVTFVRRSFREVYEYDMLDTLNGDFVEFRYDSIFGYEYTLHGIYSWKPIPKY